MIEKIVLDWLSNCLQVPCRMEEETGLPDAHVIIEKTGTSEENLIYSATFAIQSYGKTLLEAAELNDHVKKAMDDLVEHPEVTRSKLNSDYNYTDTARKKYRYQCVYDIKHY